MRKQSSILCCIMLWAIGSQANDSTMLTLESAQQLAADNYPLIRQRNLIRRTAALTLDNLQSSFLPQLTLSAQASYQSDVTQVPARIPALEFEPLSKDQYRALLDVSQQIYDGGYLGQQKRLQERADQVDQGKIDVELQKLRETINQLYFSVLMAGEQIRLVQLVEKDLDAGIARVRAQVDNGTAFRSALASLQAERIRNRQRLLEWESTRRGLLDVLGLYLARQLPDNSALAWPEVRASELTAIINRSELALLHAQDSFLLEKDRSIDVRNRPKLSAFLQAGYGRPGLNMLKNEFDPFYITGIRFNWGISALYNARRDRSLLEVQRQVLTVQEDQLLLQTRVRMSQQLTEVRKWERMLPGDEEILALREEVREATRAQLENGVATASDFIREVNAADQARIQSIVHKLQLTQAIVQYRTMAGQDLPKP